VSLARKTAAHLARNWGLYMAAVLVGIVCVFGTGCAAWGRLFTHPGLRGASITPPPLLTDADWVRGLGLVCFALAIASVVARAWLPRLPMRLTAHLVLAGISAFVVAWIVAKLIWVLAIVALLAGAEVGWRWWKKRRKVNP
jgi:hypothetical protein